jgi:hypothetical protein
MIISLKNEFRDIDKKNDTIQNFLEETTQNATGTASKGKGGQQLPKMFTVKKIIEQQQLSNSRASSLYNTKVKEDH